MMKCKNKAKTWTQLAGGVNRRTGNKMFTSYRVSVFHYFSVPLLRRRHVHSSFCHLSVSYSSLWHHCPGVCAWLHGAGLEAANLHRRRWHHRLLRRLPWGDWWCARQVAWSQHQGCQWEGVQGEFIVLAEPLKQGWDGLIGLLKTHLFFLSIRPFYVRYATWRRTWSTSSRCGQLTWLVSVSRRCPVTPSCVRSGLLLCQVC